MDSGREHVETILTSRAALAGADVSFSGAYPGWKPDPSSAVMKIVNDTYQDIYNKQPVVMVIHAGLECGLFKKPYPDMDMVSIGPTIRYPHGPDEMVNIKTVGQYWQLLVAVLERIPPKAQVTAQSVHKRNIRVILFSKIVGVSLFPPVGIPKPVVLAMTNYILYRILAR
jgi:dipeptidase D